MMCKIEVADEKVMQTALNTMFEQFIEHKDGV